MSTQTTNLGLTKPSGNEKPLVSVLNTDLDIIDEAVGDVDVQADGSLQDQIDALGESVSRKLGLTNGSPVFYARYYVTQSGAHRIYFYEFPGMSGQLGYIELTT